MAGRKDGRKGLIVSGHTGSRTAKKSQGTRGNLPNISS